MYKYIVSACLAGVNCKYNGENNLVKPVLELVEQGEALPLCPEVMAGLDIPRASCEIRYNKGKKQVIDNTGKELTEQFKTAAHKCIQITNILNINQAILKSKSPSCGSKYIYDGTFSGNLIKGKGITAEFLINAGIKVINEKEL